MDSCTLDDALRLLGNGFSIIPVHHNAKALGQQEKPWDKKPFKGVDWKKYQSELPSEEQVVEWWESLQSHKTPPSVAIITGKLSGVLVVDIDEAKHPGTFAQIQEEYPELLSSPVKVKTPGGYHYYYAYPKQPKDDETEYTNATLNHLGIDGLDCRGEGGFVLAPPSPGYELDLVPGCDWLDLPELEIPETQINTVSGQGVDLGLRMSSNPMSSYATAMKVAQDGHKISEGSRNMRLASFVGEKVNQGITDAQQLEHLCQTFMNNYYEFPLPIEEVSILINSVVSTDKRNNPQRYTPEGSRIPDTVSSAGSVDYQPNNRNLMRFHNVWETTRLPWVDWLVKGLIPQRNVSMLYGRSGVYKSFCALDMALCISREMDYHDKPLSASGHVIYIAAEASEGVIKRMVGWHQHHKLNMKDTNLTFITEAPNLIDHESVGSLTYTIEEVLKNRNDKEVALVVIDTLARSMGGGDENSSEYIEAVMRSTEAIKDKFSCGVMVVHHTGKDESRGPRGSSALLAAVDISIAVTKHDSETPGREDVMGIVVLNVEKQRDETAVEPFAFNAVRIDVKDPIDRFQLLIENENTTLIMEQTEVPESFKSKKDNKSKIDRQIGVFMRDVRDAIAVRGETLNSGNMYSLPAGLKIIRTQNLEHYLEDNTPYSETMLKTMIEECYERELLGFSKGICWSIGKDA